MVMLASKSSTCEVGAVSSQVGDLPQLCGAFQVSLGYNISYLKISKYFFVYFKENEPESSW